MNTLAEYIAVRKEWREDYKELSGNIRRTKRFIAESFRNAGSPWREQYALIELRKEATEMMAERMIMKERGKELWLAAKEKAAG